MVEVVVDLILQWLRWTSASNLVCVGADNTALDYDVVHDRTHSFDDLPVAPLRLLIGFHEHLVPLDEVPLLRAILQVKLVLHPLVPRQ